jgi:ribosomal protein S27AE
MWTIGDDGDEVDVGSTGAAARTCPGCGAADLAGDDFCHECGHAFAHFGADVDEPRGEPCPMCATGELMSLDHGRTQCDQCGYMVRDVG